LRAMNTKSLKILLVEDNPGDARLIREMLPESQHPTVELEHVDRLSKGLERLAADNIDAVLLDLGLPDSQGFDTFARMRAQAPKMPIVVLTGLDDEELSIEAVQGGAQDYLVKGRVDGALLARSVRYAIERNRLEGLVEERSAKLADSQHQLQLIADSLPVVISYVDPQLRYRFNNKTYEEWFGRSPNEIVGRHVREILGEQNYQRIHGRIEAALSGEVQSFEYELTLTSGTRYLSVTYIPDFGEQGQVKGVIVLGIDITERKRMEERLLKSKRLAAIGETAAMVGHDLRNPLQAIAGAAYLLRTQSVDKLDETGRESLQIITKSIEYSDKIINDLLEYSVEIKLQPTTTNPKAITNTTLTLTRIPENVRVLNQTQNEPTIEIDNHRIQRAFLNLIRNAVDSMPQGGTLTISSTRKDGFVEFRFTDTGTGMPQEVLNKLWTPLFTTKAKGMGFGLAITKRIIEAHGGTITADSTPRKGSTFTVKLPIQTSAWEVG
jgi:two-component system cell cycle sensor histidine kinase/response regulator CckA